MRAPERWVLEGGTVVDGTGADRRRADVLIEHGRVAAVEADLAHVDGQRLDVAGRVVAPGFVDIHSHADATVLAFPSAESATMQGVTTAVVGNCGAGAAPSYPEHDVRRVLFGYDPEWGVELSWREFDEYLDQLRDTAVNVASLVAHGVLRNAVMGLDDRPATPQELARMKDILREALGAGAVGLSTGLEYLPGRAADVEEIAALAEVVAEHDGMYATHMRDRGDAFAAAVDEAVEVARRTGVRLQLSHVAPRPYAPRHEVEAAFGLIDAARGGGLDVEVDTFPEIWAPGSLEDLFPKEIMSGTPDEVLSRLASAEGRAAVAGSFAAGRNFLVRIAGCEELYLAANPVHPEWAGLSLTELADRQGVTVADLCCDLILEAGPQFPSIAIRHLYATEDDLRRVLALPYCSLGSDGVIATGEGAACTCPMNSSMYGYVARMIEHYVADVGLLTLEEAVHRMSGLPAAMAGLHDRGTLAAGKAADLVVFRERAVCDRSRPHDPARHPAGMELVMVAGRPVVVGGAPTGARPGGAVRHGR